MAVDIICPFCGFSKETPEQAIPERAKWAICPRCRQKFEIARQEGDTASKESGSQVGQPHPVFGWGLGLGRAEAPWEQRSGKGWVRGAWETFKEVLFSPAVFFRGLSVNAGIREPFAFGLMAGAIGSMLNLFWPVVLISGGLLPIKSSVAADLGPGLLFLILAVFIPISVTVGMFISSAVLHLLLLIARGGKSGFEGTFRVVAYSQAAQAWEIVPLIGSVIGGVWRLVVWVIGLREVHAMSYARIIVAFLLPVAFFAALTIAVVIPILMFLTR